MMFSFVYILNEMYSCNTKLLINFCGNHKTFTVCKFYSLLGGFLDKLIRVFAEICKVHGGSTLKDLQYFSWSNFVARKQDILEKHGIFFCEIHIHTNLWWGLPCHFMYYFFPHWSVIVVPWTSNKPVPSQTYRLSSFLNQTKLQCEPDFIQIVKVWLFETKVHDTRICYHSSVWIKELP